MYEEYMCQVFERDLKDGAIRPIPGGGLLDSKERCIEYGEKSLGKAVRAWKNEKETTAISMGYKVWKRVA